MLSEISVMCWALFRHQNGYDHELPLNLGNLEKPSWYPPLNSVLNNQLASDVDRPQLHLNDLLKQAWIHIQWV